MKSMLKLMLVSMMLFLTGIAMTPKASATEEKKESKTQLTTTNFLISFFPSRRVTFFKEVSDGNRLVTTQEGVSYQADTYEGWAQFYQYYTNLKNQYPGAKFFTAWSIVGVSGSNIADTRFKIIHNNPSNRNEGFALQRLENGSWINVTSPSSGDLQPILEHINNVIHPNGAPTYQNWINEMMFSVSPNISMYGI